MKLHEKIKRLRREQGLSQVRLAELTEVHKAHFSRVETGKSQPSIDLLKNIAKALNVTADYLLNDEMDEYVPESLESKTLAEKIKLIEKLQLEEQKALTKIIESLLAKNRMYEFFKKETDFTDISKE